ncbi:MAG TPA: radical SAM protein [Methanoregula sp.]|nr:radical SAM protein [Methanoregula sp.]
MSSRAITEPTRHFLSRHLSPSGKQMIRLFLNTARHPSRIGQHLNLYRYERDVFRGTTITHTPPVFGATITEQCNLRCPTCLYLLENENKFHNAFITPEKFRELIRKANPGRKAEVIFITGGEPLLHPQIGELIAIAREEGLTARLSTNGILVEKKIDELEGLDYINVSLDSFDEDSFARNRGGTPHQFALIKKGIAALEERKKNFSLSFVLSSANLHEAPQMLALAEELKPPSIYFHNINPHGCTDYRPLTLQDPATVEFLKTVTSRADYPFDIWISAIFNTKSKQFRKGRCIQPWYYFCFNPAGDVAYCCHLSHDPGIGNVFSGNATNSPAMQEYRDSIIRGKIPASCLYCQRRFMESEFGHFDAKLQKWFIGREYPGYP